jgi:fermentation-respiration switch protein FrsA (DUF1100 family)
VLTIHGDSDQLFAVSMSERLYNAAATRKDNAQLFLSPSGFAHSDVSLRPDAAYWDPILDFIHVNSQQETTISSRRDST